MFRIKRDEDGAATVEFVVLFPLFIAAFFWIIETGYLSYQTVWLSRAMDLTARELMVTDVRQSMMDEGLIPKNSTDPIPAKDAHDYLLSRICDTALINDCEKNVLIALYPVSPTGNFLDKSTAQCVNLADADFSPVYTIIDGSCDATKPDMVRFEACLLVDPFMPPVVDMVRGEMGDSDYFAIKSVSAYVSEPC